MEIATYFFDTYSFFELIKGNENYKKYNTGINCVTTRLNLMEFYYGLLLKHGKELADLYFEINLPYCAEITNDTIKEAMMFRSKNKNKKFSYIDCLGYTMARKIGIKFLTGDKEFEFLPDVEFVK